MNNTYAQNQWKTLWIFYGNPYAICMPGTVHLPSRVAINLKIFSRQKINKNIKIELMRKNHFLIFIKSPFSGLFFAYYS